MAREVTIEDIRNEQNVSGFSHVYKACFEPKDNHTGHASGQTRPFQATLFRDKEKGSRLYGPRRATAEEAAQDYCDYINGAELPQRPQLKRPARKNLPKPKPLVDDLGKAIREHFKANEQKRQGEREWWIYCCHATGTDKCKVGYTSDLKKRLGQLQSGCWKELKFVGVYKLPEGTTEDEAKVEEARLHAKYIKQNVLNEWFHLTPQLLDEFPSDAPAKVGL